jgi:integrase
VAKRRGNGEGSVYRRGDGRVVGEYVDANGKRRYVSGKSKTEVKAKLRKLLADRDKGIAYDSENLTVSGYLIGGSTPSRARSGTAPGSGTSRW